MELPTVNIDHYADDYTKAYTRGRQSMLNECQEVLTFLQKDVERLTDMVEQLQKENKGL